MKSPLLLAAVLTFGCAKKDYVVVKCPTGPRTFPKDCRANYETTAKSSLIDVGGEFGTLAGVTAGANFAIGSEVVQLSEQYDQLQVQQMNTIVSLCEANRMDVCSQDPQAYSDLVAEVNMEFLAVRSELETAIRVAKGGRNADAETAVAEHLEKVAAAMARAEAVLEKAAPGT